MAMRDLPRTIELSEDGTATILVDQRLLPERLEMLRVTTWQEMVALIKDLAVRGAPALGVAGACALAVWAANQVPAPARADVDAFLRELGEVTERVAAARPTAVNLSWGARRAQAAARGAIRDGGDVAAARAAIAREARAIRDEDEAACRMIGANGAALLPRGARVLTHCNAGSLATAFYGTALGVIYAAFEQGKIERVFADETRPVGQGARLTAWELARVGVPVTLQCDDMAASLMAEGGVDAVVVGADRICANGDVANKIGTYGLAVLAAHHGIPFYVAAPSSTIDATLATGALIPIEQRDPSELGVCLPAGVDVRNPAFDVTPAALVSAIITERGVWRAPYAFGAADGGAAGADALH